MRAYNGCRARLPSKSMSFSSTGRRDVLADFLGGRLTSDAGIPLLREVDQKIGLLEAINEAILDPRDPRMTVHRQRTMLTQRIFSIELGYEDLNDQQTMRTDANTGRLSFWLACRTQRARP